MTNQKQVSQWGLRKSRPPFPTPLVRAAHTTVGAVLLAAIPALTAALFIWVLAIVLDGGVP